MDFGGGLKSYLESAAFQERAREAARLPMPFITISRQAGAGAQTLAQAILAEMGRGSDPLLRGWKVARLFNRPVGLMRSRFDPVEKGMLPHQEQA